MRDDLRTLVPEIPLKMAGQPRAVIINAYQKRRLPTVLGQNLPRSLVPIPMEQLPHILGLIASYLTIEQTCLGALRTFCLSQPPPLLKSIGVEEPANSRVGRDRLQFALCLRQSGQIVSMKLD